MEIPDELIRDLYHAAFELASFAKDECRDYPIRKKRYWLDMGIKVQKLYEAVEKYGHWELHSRTRKE